MLSSTDLQSMRATLEESLGGTAMIQTLTKVSDGGGDWEETWVSAGTVSCRFAPASLRASAEGERGDRITELAEHIVTLPAEIEVSPEDRIVANGRTYNVLAVHERTWEVSRRVEVKEIRD